MTRAPRQAVAVCAALATGVAGVAIGLSHSRSQILLTACLLALAVVWPARSVRAPWGLAAAAAALTGAATLVGYLVASEAVPSGASASPGRLVGLASVPVAMAAGWAAVARVPGLAARRAPPRYGAATAVGLIAVAVAIVPVPSIAGGDAGTDIWHGRTDTWSAGLEAVADRPLLGSGADSFFAATERYQHDAYARFAHDMPLELFVELGILGITLALALYLSAGRLLWRVRNLPTLWLLGPAFAAFLVTNLIDWTWHMAGPGSVWALALGGLLGTLAGPSTRQVQAAASV
jgi:hypothetical protein